MILGKKCYLWFFFGLVSAMVSANMILAQEAGEDVVIGKYDKLHSQILKEERTLLIHLPGSYEKTEMNYPVLYLLYGDHVNTYFAEAVAILDRLGQTGRIPEMILVGITNTDRYRDLLPQQPDGSATGIADFLQFFHAEFVPYIDKTYRTKNYRIVMGPQAGANFALYALFENPDLFNAAIITNPFRWQGGRNLIMERARSLLENDKSFKKFVHLTYDDSDELAVEGIQYINAFSEIAKGSNAHDFRLVLNFIKENDEFLQPMGLREGLKTLFIDYPFPPEIEVNSLDDILSFYEKLSAQYGFEFDVPEHVLTVQSDSMMSKRKVEQAMAILSYILEKYPYSSNAYWRLGDLSLRSGHLEEARDYLRKILEILKDDTGMIRSRLQMVEKRISGSAAYAVEKLMREAGFEAGLQKFSELRKDEATTYYFDEREFNDLGYRLLLNGKMDEAIEIFKLNVEMYPDSANTYDSLGEAYMRNGQSELAIKNYEKSLELNPENKNAREMLEKLKNKGKN